MKIERTLHAQVNLALVTAALVLIVAPMRPVLKMAIVGTLTLAAQRHAQKQELLVRDYQTAVAVAGNAVSSELNGFANWLKGHFPELEGKPKNRIQKICLDGYRELLKAPSNPIAKYAKLARQSLIFVGNPREGKSVAAHYALSAWVDEDPDLILYVFDPALGVNDSPRFRSNWLGIPRLTTCPKDVQTGVFKGSAKQLRDFLEPAYLLFQGREREEVNYPPVAMVVDELSNKLNELSEKEIEPIAQMIQALAGQAPKYGIFFWGILHTTTKEEMGLPRQTIRHCAAVMGVEAAQDKSQLSNLPRTIPPGAISFGQQQYRLRGGNPAGFVTSIPIENGYLPVPPLEGLDELLRDWVTEDGQTQLEIEFAQRLELPEVQEAIELYLSGLLKDPSEKEEPKKYLFRLIWDIPYRGDRTEHRAILDRYLEAQKNAQTNGHAEPVEVNP
ncbi:hypothetical protein NDI45_12760 [Leptolyngbya sp. GB1-A1]|uniref:hypothetical protein n=1 Tax=Leptolyngbya sp. GB1-A1 TaxID=2933908 RepID=UPI003298C7C4